MEETKPKREEKRSATTQKRASQVTTKATRYAQDPPSEHPMWDSAQPAQHILTQSNPHNLRYHKEDSLIHTSD